MENNYFHKPRVQLFDSLEDISAAALTIFVDSANRAIKDNGIFTVAISGGKTPSGFFRLLAQAPAAKQLQWDKIHLFWVDERCVPPNDPENNYRLAHELFISGSPIPTANVHRVNSELQDSDLAAQQYSRSILDAFDIDNTDIPVFDLIALGMGSDAHIASLFPHSQALLESRKIAVAVFPDDGKLNRITLTKPVITAARQIMILISGPDKAQILNHILNSHLDDIKFPVHILWPVLDRVTWLIDNDAARLITP